jgi:hypothetical protein
MSFFFFHKNREEEGKTGPDLGRGPPQEGADIRKGDQRVNTVEIFVHVYVNGKMRPVETIPGNRC